MRLGLTLLNVNRKGRGAILSNSRHPFDLYVPKDARYIQCNACVYLYTIHRILLNRMKPLEFRELIRRRRIVMVYV